MGPPPFDTNPPATGAGGSSNGATVPGEGDPSALPFVPPSDDPNSNAAGASNESDSDGDESDDEQPQPNGCNPWPAATGNRDVSATLEVSGTFDGGLMRFTGIGPLGNGSQEEGQDALFELAPGATLRNVILGSPAADGIHCQGACTLENVWWEDVGEDAATFRGNSSNQNMSIRCGGARSADDKVFQHNGAGTLTIEDFVVEDFGKLYRSCGNCGTQFARHIVLRSITAREGSVLVGINSNLGDTAEFENITLFGEIGVCDRYTGNDTGAEPTRNGSGADGQSCIFTTADITQR